MTNQRHHVFRTSGQAGPLPFCAVELIDLLGEEATTRLRETELLPRCRGCARKFTPRGWLGTDSPLGIWEGCAHRERLERVMSR